MDEEKRITLEQLEITARRIKQDYDGKFGELSEDIATIKEVAEMLEKIFGSPNGDTDDSTLVTSLDALREALADESVEKIVLGADISSEEAEIVKLEDGVEKIIDLAGHTIECTNKNSNSTIYTVYVTGKSTLNLVDSGEIGKIDGGSRSRYSNECIMVDDGSVVNIYGGSYTCGSEDESSSDTIYAYDGDINIFGGEFENSAWDEEQGIHGESRVMNIRNNSGSRITCYGGTYVGQNPANGDDKDTATGTTFVADGYTVEAEERDGRRVYIVVQD